MRINFKDAIDYEHQQIRIRGSLCCEFFYADLSLRSIQATLVPDHPVEPDHLDEPRTTRENVGNID